MNNIEIYNNSPIYPIKISKGGDYLAAASLNSNIIVWEVKNGKEKKKLQGHSGEVTSLCFSPDGESLISGSDDSNIIVWDVKNNDIKNKKNFDYANVSITSDNENIYLLVQSLETFKFIIYFLNKELDTIRKLNLNDLIVSNLLIYKNDLMWSNESGIVKLNTKNFELEKILDKNGHYSMLDISDNGIICLTDGKNLELEHYLF